ncbi:MAG: phosphatidate cytidylyltransferase [Gammaproteobacteria bacterium]|jgi:phosphatidate cytidylyltransferase|nr:phosphatidate cytidylyltransferase [SAR86 cluster bacterium]MEC7197646.1 phosphatidate cytidylyltransferase [Pseudomonadota bacterium]MEC9227115.1 phosphatidate cytidylyltransferase [Pseudomonadota bacterium]GIR51784.1 MAG: phosphatidate cytidylyltransferase [Gammaproteobacteria bacterium]|tara:strand:- start:40 stop:663 length:624 start_codon:yes stop_codon:yes gene_type:complete
MIRWISGIALGFLFLAYILLSPSFFFNFGLIIIFGISIYELIKLRVFSLQSLLAFILIVTAILCLYLYELERSLILIAVMISVATDAFAFFAGKVLGRNKIFPIISPNKTLEGTIGGVVSSVVINSLMITLIFQNSLKTLDVIMLTLMIFICAVAAVFGDLLISSIKRQANLKDTGSLIPGHGGLLDRIDSHILCIPVFFVLYEVLL